ncbi:hypothetical protein [Blastococcus sp. SYSU D00813]
MTEQQPPDGTAPVPGQDPAGGWPPPSSPVPPPAPSVPVPVAGAPDVGWRRRPVLTALAVAVVAVLGTAAAAATATTLVLWRADDVGERIGAGAGEALGRAQLEATEQMYELEEEYVTDGSYGWSAYGPPDVEQFPPVPPGDLGADPELDQYAQECFDGDLDSCDDLYSESPPLSAYEEYAATCGGRVKSYSAPFCTDLE